MDTAGKTRATEAGQQPGLGLATCQHPRLPPSLQRVTCLLLSLSGHCPLLSSTSIFHLHKAQLNRAIALHQRTLLQFLIPNPRRTIELLTLGLSPGSTPIQGAGTTQGRGSCGKIRGTGTRSTLSKPGHELWLAIKE